MVDKESLRRFLIDSNRAGYAGGEEKKWIKEPDGSTSIPFTKGEWRSHDNFFGGEPYGGRVVVFFQDRPVWIMVYYGFVEEGAEAAHVYQILRAALVQMPEDAPYRGPSELKAGEYTYHNTWQGDIERYSGEERISLGDTVIYQAHYSGGLVDKRQEV